MIQTMMTTKEAADKLGIHVVTLRRIIQKGEIQVVRIGQGHKISQEALDAYVKRQTTEAR